MFSDIKFGTGTQNLIFDLAAILLKLGLLLGTLIFFQRLYTKTSKNSAEGHTKKTILAFRAILSIFALGVIALNWLPWLWSEIGALNAYHIIIEEKQYFLAIPLLIVLLALVQTWRRSVNAPASLAPLFAAYAISVIVFGLPSLAYSSAGAIGPAWLSLMVAGVAIFPAILYAEGMPHPTNRLLYRFINLGKVSYDEAVHYAARALLISYRGSAAPTGFSAAEGEHKGKHVRIFGGEGNTSSNKIVAVAVSGALDIDDIIINRLNAWPEVYFKSLGIDVPEWYENLLDDETWDPPVEHLEIEVGDIVIADDYEVVSTNQKTALEMVKVLHEDIIDLDADLIYINKKQVYICYDFSRMRMPAAYLFDKAKLHFELLEKLEKHVGAKEAVKKPAKSQKPTSGKSIKDKEDKAKRLEGQQAKARTTKTTRSKARKKGNASNLPGAASS